MAATKGLHFAPHTSELEHLTSNASRHYAWRMFGALAKAWNDPSPFEARMMLLAAAGFWSLGGFFIKEIDAGAMSIVFFRCLFSAAILVPFIRGRRFPGPIDSGVSVAFFALLLVMYVASTKETSAANAIFLQYTAPIYVALIGPFILSERLRSREALPFVICIAGIAVLFLGNSGSGETKGLLLGAGSGFFYGMFFIWLRRLRYADAIAITLINCLGVVVLLVAVPSVWHVSATDIGLLVIMAAVQFALPYVLFTRGVAHVPVAEASLIALIEPVLNPVWVALFYGEDPSFATIVGGAVILAGLVVRYTVLRPTTLELEAGAAELAGGPAVPDGGETPS
ncbi:MAG: DMT family transporter [Chloroflexota bacterium]|nr:DMT family transporter [Chloroflexota bacterium]